MARLCWCSKWNIETLCWGVPVNPSFFVGARVLRKFVQGVFSGTVTHVIDDEGETLWHVEYEDFDAEDLSADELHDAIYFHPTLDASSDMVLPTLGSFVWYSADRLPRLGQVTGLDPTVARPVTVRVFEPRSGAGALHLARFRPRPPAEGVHDEVGCHDQLYLTQVRFGFEALTNGDRMPSSAQKRLRACLRR